MNQSDIQAIVDMVTIAATKAAMSGYPVERIQWVPPATGSQDWRGALAIQYH